MSFSEVGQNYPLVAHEETEAQGTWVTPFKLYRTSIIKA